MARLARERPPVVKELKRDAITLLGYEAWRKSHTFLGIAALVFALVHVFLAGRYISTAWKAWLIVAICVAMVGAYAFVRLVRPALMRRAPYKVAEVRPERGSVWSLALRAPGHPGMRFLPGQYGYLKLGSPYSLWNRSLRGLSATESSVVNNTMLVQIALLAFLVLRETITTTGCAGIALVAVGLLAGERVS